MRLMRRREVETMTGLGTSSLYRAMRAGDFPVAVKVGPSAVRWRSDEIEAWLEGLKRAEGEGRSE